MDQAFHTWPARYRHWRLEIVESDDHYHWLLTTEIRQLLPRFRADKALENVYGASIRRLDTGPNLYISESALVRELKRMGGQESLKFLAWLKRDIVDPGRRKRGEKPGVHEHFESPEKEDEPDEVQSRHVIPPARAPIPRVRAQHHKPQRPTPALSWTRLLTSEIVEHWRGSIPLTRAFFRSGLALVLWLGVTLYLLSAVKDISTYTGSYLLRQLGVLVILLLLAVGFVWWCVGLGRSALRWHHSGGGLLASLSSFLVASTLMVITTVVVVLASYEWIQGLFYTVTRRPAPAEVLHDPTLRRIILRGPLNFGSYKVLEEALKQKPRLTLIEVESPGGYVVEGFAMARLIRENGLDTVTFDHCESACTFLLAAGKDRFLGPDAKVGFHRSWAPGVAFSRTWMPVDYQIADLYRAQGSSEAFVKKALDTPGYSMWYPDQYRMIESGFATTYWAERGMKY